MAYLYKKVRGMDSWNQYVVPDLQRDDNYLRGLIGSTPYDDVRAEAQNVINARAASAAAAAAEAKKAAAEQAKSKEEARFRSQPQASFNKKQGPGSGAKKAGRGNTLLTGVLGASEEARTRKKSLLGM